MSFIEKIDECKNLNSKDVKKSNNLFEIRRSFNYKVKDKDLKNVKVIIVGTISPYKAIKNGYFYTTDRNQMLKIIDEYFGSNLSQLKNNPGQLHKEIIEKRIAFLDVIHYAAIFPQESCADDDIAIFSLDYDKFKKLNNRNDIVYLFNSRNAEEAFKVICDKNNNSHAYNSNNYCKLFRGVNKSAWLSKFKNAGL